VLSKSDWLGLLLSVLNELCFSFVIAGLQAAKTAKNRATKMLKKTDAPASMARETVTGLIVFSFFSCIPALLLTTTHPPEIAVTTSILCLSDFELLF
jgi:flagellar biosynthesis protein FliP